MWSRWGCVHFFGTTDLLLILNQVRAHIVLSRKKNGKTSTKPTKQVVRDTRAGVRWCDKEGTLTGKQKLNMKRFPKGVRSDKTRASKSLTSSQLKLHRFWMARAPFDLRRATRAFIPILQAALTLWILWCLIASDQVRLHLSITPCTFARDRTGWCSHAHHVVWPLGFTFPKFTPGPCANSRFLVDLVFVVVELLKSLDGPVSGSDELSMLCRSSYEPSDFISGHPLCTYFGCDPNGDSGTPEDDGLMWVLESSILMVFQRGFSYSSLSE